MPKLKDFDEAFDSVRSKPGAKRRLDVILADEVDATQAAKIEARLRDPKVAHRTIARAITAMGISCSESAVTTWRRSNGVTA